MEKKIDPELIRQLEPTNKAATETGEGDEEFIEAVIKIEGEGDEKDQEFEALLEKLLQRLEESEHLRPEDYNVFPLMQRAVIRAKKGYIKKLIDQVEVVAAMANRRKE